MRIRLEVIDRLINRYWLLLNYIQAVGMKHSRSSVTCWPIICFIHQIQPISSQRGSSAYCRCGQVGCGWGTLQSDRLFRLLIRHRLNDLVRKQLLIRSDRIDDLGSGVLTHMVQEMTSQLMSSACLSVVGCFWWEADSKSFCFLLVYIDQVVWHRLERPKLWRTCPL